MCKTGLLKALLPILFLTNSATVVTNLESTVGLNLQLIGMVSMWLGRHKTCQPRSASKQRLSF